MFTDNIWDSLEDVKRRSRAPSSSPEVTIQKGGSIGLNQASIEALGRPARVRIAIRLDPPLLGIRPSDEHPDAYTVQDNSRGAVINAKTALSHLGIPLDAARRYPAQAIGGGLIVDLSTAGEVVSRGGDGSEST